MSLSVVLSAVSAWPEVRRGGERYLHELAAALVRRGHQVRVVTSAPHAGRGEVLGVPVHAVRRPAWPARSLGPHGHQLWFGAQALPRAVRGAQVWHALTLGDAAAAGLAGRAGGPASVHTALGIPARLEAAGGWSRRAHAVAFRTVDAYVCLSPRATQGLPPGRPVEVVGAGVDLDRFVPADRRNTRPALLFASDADAPQKNLPLLLEACRGLVRDHPDLELWLAGPGDPRPHLDAADPRVADRVTLASRVDPDELARRYAAAWATVLPSRNEAFGLVALESLAAGTPAVVLADEGPALFVDATVGATAPADPDGLATACRTALDLAARSDTRDACRTRAAAHGWDTHVAPAIEAVYLSSLR